MELTQLEQMIRWLDEERKRDKAQIAALQERTEQQLQQLQLQTTELASLHQELAELRLDLRRTDDYPQIVEKTHRDLSSTIEEIKTTVRRERLEAEQTRRTEIALVNDLIAEMDKKIRPLFRYEEALKAREAGEQRLQGQVQTLTNSVADVTKRTEDRFQSIVYLEEQRRADTRRIAAVEGELPNLRKPVDELAARQIRLEDSIRKIPPRVEEAVEIAKSYAPRIEELRIADFQREQRVKQYLEQAAQVNEEVTRLVEQTQRYALLYNQNRQALEGLEAFQARLEKRQNEIAEMQRLTDERLRRQWEEWQTIFARDWQKRQVTEEDRWRRQDINNQKLTEHLAEIDEQTEYYYTEIVALWEEMQNVLDRWRKSIQDTLTQNQTAPADHIKELRRYAEDKYKQLL